MESVRIGLLGCGTVGGGVVRLLESHATNLAQQIGRPLELARVLVRDPDKRRAAPVDPRKVTTRAEDILEDPTIDVIVELMGGVDPALGYVRKALTTRRSVVTANKMLLAFHGAELIDTAVEQGVDLAFEGAVGGGIPIIRTLRESLAGDKVVGLSGIVNGTCNYILSCMQNDGLAFDLALRQAQDRGYAEADPTLDIDGHDAAHKLAVLSMVAFGAQVDAEAVPTEGIRAIEPIDHRFAERFGYAIKHLAIGRDRGDAVELRVHPTLLRRDSTLANVSGVMNAIRVDGEALGPCLLSGRGAGDLPTAVSVVADIVDVASARLAGAAGRKASAVRLSRRPLAPADEVESRYYLRFRVFDRPGVLARITGALGYQHVSIHQMIQEGGGDSSGAPVDVVIVTHAAKDHELRRALREIEACDFVASPTRVLRIFD